MIHREGWSLASAMFGMALGSLFLAALVAPADRDSLVSVAVVGHLLWLAAMVSDYRHRRLTTRVQRCWVSCVVFGAFALGELLGLGLSRTNPDTYFTVWFGVALALAIAGVIGAIAQEPGDAVFVGQLLFHGVTLLPLGLQVVLAIATWTGASVDSSRYDAIVGATIQIYWVLAPGVLAALVKVIAGLNRAPGNRNSAWIVLVCHQAAIVLLLFRWTLSRA